jgi:tetrahydromethanopterin S-methyltransferase subunit G
MQPAIDPIPSASENAAMEARLARLETHTEHINANVADLRAGLGRLEVKVDQGFARVDAKVDQLSARLDAKIDRNFLILGGMIVSLSIGMAGLMAKGFHWL